MSSLAGALATPASSSHYDEEVQDQDVDMEAQNPSENGGQDPTEEDEDPVEEEQDENMQDLFGEDTVVDDVKHEE